MEGDSDFISYKQHELMMLLKDHRIAELEEENRKLKEKPHEYIEQMVWQETENHRRTVDRYNHYLHEINQKVFATGQDDWAYRHNLVMFMMQRRAF